MATSFTPRHLRRKGNASRNGSVGEEKQRAFRRVAQLSKQFIHQSANALEGNERYLAWCGKADRGALRT